MSYDPWTPDYDPRAHLAELRAEGRRMCDQLSALACGTAEPEPYNAYEAYGRMKALIELLEENSQACKDANALIRWPHLIPGRS